MVFPHALTSVPFSSYLIISQLQYATREFLASTILSGLSGPGACSKNVCHEFWNIYRFLRNKLDVIDPVKVFGSSRTNTYGLHGATICDNSTFHETICY
jgi:hypothetical protein